MKLFCSLPKNRLLPGVFTATTLMQEREVTIFTAKCLGRADTFLAERSNNPSRNPLLPGGDTPCGEYTCALADVGNNLRSYGPFERIAITPVAGPALQAKLAGRTGLMIHGGAPGTGGGLRPTEGCIRLSNSDMQKLIELYTAQGVGCTLFVLDQ